MQTFSIKQATIINMVGKYSNVVIQLIINAILARLLSPEDFGIVAILTVFTNFFTILSDMGIGTGIIQKKLSKDDYNSIYSFTFFLGIILSLAFILLGIPIAKIYENNLLFNLCFLLSFSVFFNTINLVPNALLLKSGEFLAVAFRTIIVNICVGIITVVLAFLGFKYYALILNSIFVALFTFILTRIKTKLNFTFKIDISSLKKIRDISTYQFAFSFINYFSRNSDNMLIGKFLGNSALAYYDKSYKLMLYPNNMLTGVISSSLHPILSRYQNDPEYIYSKYLKVLEMISVFGCFIAGFCYLSSKEIVNIMYGPNWNQSITSFQILSFSIFSQMFCSSTGAIFQSLGKTKLQFKAGVITSIMIVSTIIVSLYFNSINYTALFISIAYNICFFITFYFLIVFGFNKSFRIFLKDQSRILIVYIVFLLICMLLKMHVVIKNYYISFVFKFSISFICYAFLLFLSKRIKSKYKIN